MNCAKCPHMRRIKAALEPCQTCDAGRLGGTCHVDAAKMDYAMAHRAANDHAPTEGVTRLAPEDEDRLRRAMSTLFGLDAIDLLLVQHLFQRKKLADFGNTLLAVARKIGRYKGAIASRSMAQAKKEGIIRVFPQVSDVFKHIIDETTGAGAGADRIDDLI